MLLYQCSRAISYTLQKEQCIVTQVTSVCCHVTKSPGAVCFIIEMSLTRPAFINKCSYFNTTLVKFTAAKTTPSGKGESASHAATLVGCRVVILVPLRKNRDFVLTSPSWSCGSLTEQKLQGGLWWEVGQTDFPALARGSKLCPLLPCSSASCLASWSEKGQGLEPLLALEVGTVPGSEGGWGSQRKGQSLLLNLGPGSHHLPRAGSARGLCVSGCLLCG